VATDKDADAAGSDARAIPVHGIQTDRRRILSPFRADRIA
jgi:hypothetical protein